MTFLSSTLIEFEMGLSMSYCPGSGTTNAWLFGRHTPRHAALVERDITFLAEMADHPLFLPYLLCTYLKSSVDRQIYSSMEKLFTVEAESGQSGIVLVGRNGVMPRGNCDDPELSKRATGISQLAIALNGYCQGLLLNIESIQRAFCKMDSAVPDLSCRRVVTLQQRRMLEERLEHLHQKARYSVLRIAHLRERAMVQSSAVWYREASSVIPPSTGKRTCQAFVFLGGKCMLTPNGTSDPQPPSPQGKRNQRRAGGIFPHHCHRRQEG